MKKKLYKDSKTAKISGVLSGIAQYLNVDPTVIRVCYVLMCLLLFRITPGIIVYIVLSFIMPDKTEIGHQDYEVK